MSQYNFEFSATVLNHLGRQLYRNFITVIGEAISNSWDANADNVWIEIDSAGNEMFITDDGDGMDAEDLQNKFLKIGYSKRGRHRNITEDPKTHRPYIGAKGIGKLALLSCAKQVSVATISNGQGIVSCLIDNDEIDEAIEKDESVSQIALPQGSERSIERLQKHLRGEGKSQISHGTVVHFSGLYPSRNTEQTLRKALAMSYRFSLIDHKFSIYLNDKKVGLGDLQDLADATQYVWKIGGINDPFLKTLKDQICKVAAHSESVDFSALEKLRVKGFLASVRKPQNLAIYGRQERVGIDIYVNGRVRETNIMQRIPTARVSEQYFYGQLHLNDLDRPGFDAFVSSREGIRGDDEKYNEFLEIFSQIIPRVFEQWDELRIEDRQDGDPDNTKKITQLQRKNRAYAAEVVNSLTPDNPTKEHMQRLRKAESGLDIAVDYYAHLYVTENLMRQTIIDEGKGDDSSISQSTSKRQDPRPRREREIDDATKSLIPTPIRQNQSLLYYMHFMELVKYLETLDTARIHTETLTDTERNKIRLLRNAVMHTSDLTKPARKVFEEVMNKLRDIMKTQ